MEPFFGRMKLGCLFLLLAICPLSADAPLTLFKIDPTVRGVDIDTIVATFNAAPYVTTLSEVAIQTGSGFILSPAFAPYVFNGLIPYVESATAAPNGTLLTVAYNPNGSLTKTQFLIVPIEKMAAVMFSPKAIPPGSTIVSPYPQGELVRYDVDPVSRAADLKTVFDAFDLAFLSVQKQSSIGIFTTLQGPFNPPIFGGFIPNVQTVTVSGAYLIIDYLPYSLSGRTFHKTNATIIVTAEQVIQMVYFANRINFVNGQFQ